MANTNPARGMRDFLPAQVRQREYVISIIKEVYESYGFEPLETPAVENLETLTGKYGEEGNHGRDLHLFTARFARVVGTKKNVSYQSDSYAHLRAHETES